MNDARRQWPLYCMALLCACMPRLAAAQAGAGAPEPAARVLVAAGAVTDTGADGRSRALADGDTVYAGDTVGTAAGGYASLDFEDGGELILRPSTQLQIRQYHFDAASHDPPAAGSAPSAPAPDAPPAGRESAVFSLAKGGLRAVSGLIGHLQHDDYALQTPTATLGIRGTAYDLRYCQDDCTDEAEQGVAPDNGLYASVSQGAIALRNDAGESLTGAGQSAHVRARGVLARRLAGLPAALRHMDLPEALRARAAAMRQRIHAERALRQQRRMQRRAARQAENGDAPATADHPLARRLEQARERRAEAQAPPSEPAGPQN